MVTSPLRQSFVDLRHQSSPFELVRSVLKAVKCRKSEAIHNENIALECLDELVCERGKNQVHEVIGFKIPYRTQSKIQNFEVAATNNYWNTLNKPCQSQVSAGIA